MGGAVARRYDPFTSWEAARSVLRISASQEAIRGLLRTFGPMTDDELLCAYNNEKGMPPRISPSGLRTRRKELVRAGIVEDSGERRELPSGRLGIAWKCGDSRDPV